MTSRSTDAACRAWHAERGWAATALALDAWAAARGRDATDADLLRAARAFAGIMEDSDTVGRVRAELARLGLAIVRVGTDRREPGT